MKRASTPRKPSPRTLDAMIDEATVDCYNIDEQRSGFFTMLEDNLILPFDTQVLGVTVSVQSLDLSDGGEIVAVCTRGAITQRIPILDLPLPDVLPEGVMWIKAYRRWCGHV